jgi:peptide/nickel transport system permease protein
MAEPHLSLDPMTISEARATTRVTPVDERIFVASQWQLMWWRFRKHKLAMASGVIVIGFYLAALGADFLAYADPHTSEAQRSLMPPQPLYFFDGWRFSPHVYAIKGRRDPMTFKRVYQVDANQKIPVRFFARGFDYKFLGFIPTNIHLLGANAGMETEKAMFLLGTDVQGRDLWSRLLYATRISLTIGLVGVTLSLFLGVLLGWTELARVVRGRFLALREEDFVVSARLVGCSQMRILFVHMVPSFMSHIIAATTLALPAMIISETALSFLGLGLRPPAISWGVLLQQAQNVQTVAISPWLMLPSLPVIVAVLAFNFLGDGLRDAADPYGH